VGETLIKVELNPGHSFQIGEKVNISLNLEKMLIFDPSTEKRIKPEVE
jgi:hypothetical protein